MDLATSEQLDRFAVVLVDLATRHGMSNLRQAGDGRLVADVARGRTYFDIAAFELEAEPLLGAALSVIPSGAPLAPSIAGRPIQAAHAA